MNVMMLIKALDDCRFRKNRTNVRSINNKRGKVFNLLLQKLDLQFLLAVFICKILKLVGLYHLQLLNQDFSPILHTILFVRSA